jgi:hypothetical protein
MDVNSRQLTIQLECQDCSLAWRHKQSSLSIYSHGKLEVQVKKNHQKSRRKLSRMWGHRSQKTLQDEPSGQQYQILLRTNRKCSLSETTLYLCSNYPPVWNVLSHNRRPQKHSHLSKMSSNYLTFAW